MLLAFVRQLCVHTLGKYRYEEYSIRCNYFFIKFSNDCCGTYPVIQSWLECFRYIDDSFKA
jgi:hypothetical protein